MFLSSTVNVVELMVVVVPLTVKSPVIVTFELKPTAPVNVETPDTVAFPVIATLDDAVRAAKPAVPVNVGDAENTTAEEPVSSVSAEAKFADDGVARNVATLAPRPETPVDTGNPVQLVRVPDVGVPRTGVTRVGDVANTLAPVPVSSVSAAAKFEDEGVAKNVATLAARPETPVEIGNPVQLVNVPDVGVPRIGVTRVGDVANTLAPVPVSSVSAAAKFEDEGVAKNVATLAARPETPVDTGNPVQLVRVPEEGVPNTGVVRVGDVSVLLVNVSVEDTVTTLTPSTAILPAAALEIVVSEAFPNSRLPPTAKVFVLASNVKSASVADAVIVPDVILVRTTL
jgi:hypothetical protein